MLLLTERNCTIFFLIVGIVATLQIVNPNSSVGFNFLKKNIFPLFDGRHCIENNPRRGEGLEHYTQFSQYRSISISAAIIAG